MENMDLIYKRVINASLDVIISINEKEEILLWNDASSKTFGYMEDEVLGKPITLIIPKKYHRKHKNGMRKFIEKKLEDMAIRDSLTWMYNRHYFNEVINREFERAKRYRYFISMMIIDV